MEFCFLFYFNEDYKLPSIKRGVDGEVVIVHTSIVLVATVKAVDVSALVQGPNATKRVFHYVIKCLVKNR